MTDEKASLADGGLAEATRNELQALFSTARDLHAAGHLSQAAELYQTILLVDSQHADAMHLLGLIAFQSGNVADAIAGIRGAIALKRHPQFFFHLGLAYQAGESLDDAGEAYDNALELRPDYLPALENRGVVAKDSAEDELAERLFRKALEIEPASRIALLNLGTVLLNRGADVEARKMFERTLELAPLDADAHLKRSQTRLRSGDFAGAWSDYEWRFYAADYLITNTPASASYPQWIPGLGKAARVLVTAEQGIGDELMFASCLPDLEACRSEVTLECDRRLASLLKRSFPDVSLVERGSDLNNLAVDWRCAAGSLPGFFRRSEAGFSNRAGFLIPCPTRKEHWRQKLNDIPGRLKIGISWRGGADARSRNARSIALEAWKPVFLAADDCAFVDLQYGDNTQQVAAFNRDSTNSLLSLQGLDVTNDLDELAAACSALDLIITIDNSLIHLAGALGARSWLLLAASAERRWLGSRPDSPWYPSIRLFRQEAAVSGDWGGVIREVANALSTAEPKPREQFDVAAPAPSQTAAHSPAPKKRSVLLLNDTSSWYHWGCSCTSMALASRLRANGATRLDSLPIYNSNELASVPDPGDWLDASALSEFERNNMGLVAAIQAADSVVVNGEGTLHGMSSSATNLLFLVNLAARVLEKPTQIINHSVYPNSAGETESTQATNLYQEIYAALSACVIRETRSSDVASALGIEHVQGFDCLPLFVEDHRQHLCSGDRAKRVTFGGSAAWGVAAIQPLASFVHALSSRGYECVFLYGANGYVSQDDRVFGEQLYHATEGVLEISHARSEIDWLNSIAESDLLVSGRFHHSIAAAMLGTPFVVSPSNTPKIKGLTDMLDLSHLFCETIESFTDMLESSVWHLLGSRRSDAIISAETRGHLASLAEQNFSAPV